MTSQEEKLASLKGENAQLRLRIAIEQQCRDQQEEIHRLTTDNHQLRHRLHDLKVANGTA